MSPPLPSLPHLQKLAAASTFLACKLEECTRIRVREVVMVFDRLWKRKDNAPLTLLEPGTRVSGAFVVCVCFVRGLLGETAESARREWQDRLNTTLPNTLAGVPGR